MKAIFFKASTYFTLLFFSSCAVSIFYDMDKNAELRSYKTFAWYEKVHHSKHPDFDNDIIESNVKNFASAELKKKGWFVNVDSPDVILDYEIMINHKTSEVSTPVYGQSFGAYNPATNQFINKHPYNFNGYNAFNNGTYIAPVPYVVGYNTEKIAYDEGALLINVIDRKSNRLVWKGWAVGTVNDVQSYEYELQNDIHRIFKHFPKQQMVK